MLMVIAEEKIGMYKNSGIRVSFPGHLLQKIDMTKCLFKGILYMTWQPVEYMLFPEADAHLEIFYTNVKVANNTIIRTGADGQLYHTALILLLSTIKSWMQAIMVIMSPQIICAGLWGDNNNGEILFQYNEVARTSKFNGDGQAFDTDWGTGGTSIFQYNYTHEMMVVFFLNCAELSQNPDYIKTILRYNISVNDEQSMVWRDNETLVEVYNNVFYKTSGNLDPGNCKSYKYWNNIFYFTRILIGDYVNMQ